MAAALAWAPPLLPLYLGAGRFIKWSCSLDRHIRGICHWLASDPSVGRDFTWSDGGDRSWLASSRSPSSAAPVRLLQALIKHRLGILSSLPTWAFDGAARPFTPSRPLRPGVAAIPGMPAGRFRCLWPT
jgi:hypothetical protein